MWTDGIISRFEAEVNVGDFANTKLILEKLGFMVTASYEKYRSTFFLDNTEIVLDELPFGNFVEIEGLLEGYPTVSRSVGFVTCSSYQLWLFAALFFLPILGKKHIGSRNKEFQI